MGLLLSLGLGSALLGSVLSGLLSLGNLALLGLVLLGSLTLLALCLLGSFLLCGLGCCGNCEYFRNGLHLIMLSEILENEVKLIVLKNLHMVFGCGGILRQYLGDDLAGKVKVLGHLVNSVFIITAHTLFFLLIPVLLPRVWGDFPVLRFSILCLRASILS